MKFYGNKKGGVFGLDNFILENDTWLKYLPVVIYGMIIVIAVFLILIGFLIYKRYKNQNLKSRNRKSAFAAAYADCFIPNASSSVPLKRNNNPETEPEEENHFIHVQQPATPINDRPNIEGDSNIIEFYFEYEDEYKI